MIYIPLNRVSVRQLDRAVKVPVSGDFTKSWKYTGSKERGFESHSCHLLLPRSTELDYIRSTLSVMIKGYVLQVEDVAPAKAVASP